MNDTFTARQLVQSLGELMRAEAEEMREREQYVGYSWDYHGQEYIRRRERAAEQFIQLLDEYLLERFGLQPKSAGAL